MASGILGQVAPGATTATTLYTCPSSTKTVLNILLCNRGATSATFRIALRKSGAALANEHYVVFDETIAANKPYEVTVGISVAATDEVEVFASSANLSFSAFGDEESI